jgi:hypothetical protein
LVPNAFHGRLVMQTDLDDIAHCFDLVDMETFRFEAVWFLSFSETGRS